MATSVASTKAMTDADSSERRSKSERVREEAMMRDRERERYVLGKKWAQIVKGIGKLRLDQMRSLFCVASKKTPQTQTITYLRFNYMNNIKKNTCTRITCVFKLC